ncbi:MAG: hypothetical protein H0X43_01710 [Nitrosospira sp.]|nr:hypothetical protein [Nitrosospira sp.]
MSKINMKTHSRGGYKIPGRSEPLTHIPKSQKKEWAVAKLGRSIENAFSTGDKIMIFTFSSPKLNAECALMYTPVSSRLQEITCRLGDYLHFSNGNFDPGLTWWNHLRDILDEGYGELLLANSGELVGVPLLHRTTGRINVRAVIPKGDPRENFIAELTTSGEGHVINVQFIEPSTSKKTFGIEEN